MKRDIRSILPKLDMVGFVLFVGFAVMLELALAWGGSEYPWESITIIGLFYGALISLMAFIAWERHVGDMAMMPPSVVCKQEVWSASLFLGFLSASMLVCSYYLPIYFQAVKGVSAFLSGVYMLPSIIPQILMAVTSGALSKSGQLGPPYYLPCS